MSSGNGYPGITILRPNSTHGRRARWVDPETGKRRFHTLPQDEAEAHKWLLRKAAELMTRRAITMPPPGAAPSLELTMEKYLQERHRLRESTLTQYRYSITKLVKWLDGKPPTLQRLRAWRAHLDAPGRAAASVNRDLAHVSAFLHHARKSGDVLLTRDQISDGLERLESDHEKKEPLTVSELRALVTALGAAHGEYRAFVLVLLLTGMRLSECLNLQPSRVHRDANGRALEIRLRREDTKTKKPRTIDLSVSPACQLLMDSFRGWTLTKDQVRDLRERLHPWATFQRLRVTCGTFLTCAPGIYGGASAYMSAARLGHSVAIAEKHYVGVVRVPPEAKTLEAAMGIEDLVETLNDK